MVYIRKSEPQDWEIIQRILSDAFTIFGGDEPQKVISLVEKLLKEPEEYISLIAQMQGQNCGYILFYPTTHEGQLYYILAPIGVLTSFQKKAVGSHLIQSALNELPKECVGVLVLGDKYYTRFGFKPCSDYNLKQPFEGTEEHQYFLSYPNFVQPNQRTTITYPTAFFDD
ncbi:MAG: GNAT family N-acetyltransferase [Alphaproteobacteria bacterium]